MITVTIWRSTLVRHGACEGGLALFDAIASQQPESDPRRLRRIRIPRWGALHWIMLVQAGYGEWLACRGIVPRANLPRAGGDPWVRRSEREVRAWRVTTAERAARTHG